jgi:hypothetical protein
MVTVGAKAGDTHRFRVAKVETDRLTVTAGVADPVTQFYTGTWVVFEPDGTKFYPISGRNVTHHEMDLMAQLAGLDLEHRWSDWKGNPFTADATLHISVYRKPTA